MARWLRATKEVFVSLLHSSLLQRGKGEGIPPSDVEKFSSLWKREVRRDFWPRLFQRLK
jgi:hypothetical protein